MRRLASMTAWILGGLLLLVMVLIGPRWASDGVSTPGGIRVSLPALAALPNLTPTVGWSAGDTAAVYVGFPAEFTNLTGHGPAPGRRVTLSSGGHVVAAGVGDTLARGSVWVVGDMFARAPREAITGLAVPLPQFHSEGFVAIPNHVTWRAREFGLQSIVARTGQRSRVLLRRWVWNVPAPEAHTCGLLDPRGSWRGFILRRSSNWNVWLWSEDSIGTPRR